MVTLFWVGAVLSGTSAGYLVGSSESRPGHHDEQVRMTVPRGVWVAALVVGAAAMVLAAIAGLVAIAPKAT